MEDNTIVVDKHTKIAYGLHNFFTPMLFYTVMFSELLDNNSTAAFFLVLFLPITTIISLALLFGGIFSYSKFIKIDDDYLYVCRKTFQNIKVLNRINRSDIKEIKTSTIHHVLAITNDNRKIKLLTPTPSMFLIVLTLPFISIPFLLRKTYLTKIKQYEISNALGLTNEGLEKEAANCKKRNENY